MLDVWAKQSLFMLRDKLRGIFFNLCKGLLKGQLCGRILWSWVLEANKSILIYGVDTLINKTCI